MIKDLEGPSVAVQNVSWIVLRTELCLLGTGLHIYDQRLRRKLRRNFRNSEFRNSSKVLRLQRGNRAWISFKTYTTVRGSFRGSFSLHTQYPTRIWDSAVNIFQVGVKELGPYDGIWLDHLKTSDGETSPYYVINVLV